MSRKVALLLCAAYAVAVVGVSLLWAQPGVVRTTDGRTIAGDVGNEDLDNVTVTVKGGTTIIPRNQIVSIEFTGSLQEEYHRRLAALPKDATADDHVELARWLFAAKAYDLVQVELATALRMDPNNADANTLTQTLASQMRMEKRAEREAAARNQPPPAAEAPVVSVTPASTTTEPALVAAPPATTVAQEPIAGSSADGRYLSTAQINAIRQSEWRPGDDTMRVQFVGDVRRRYLKDAADITPAVFNALTPTQQALRILANGSTPMRRDVQLLSDPAPIAEYRRVVQPMIISGCAATACHGGENPHGFFLYNQADHTEPAYTNFYLLTAYGKTIDNDRRAMLDRTYPQMSLLAQYALGADVAATPHPTVAKGQVWHGIFKGRTDPRYLQLVGWMGRSLATFAPDYGIKFVLPAPEAPVIQPATAPQ